MKKRFSKKANRLLCVLAALMLVITSISIGVVADSTTNPFPTDLLKSDAVVAIAVEPAAVSSVTLKDGEVVKATVGIQSLEGKDGFGSGCGLAVTNYGAIKASIEKKYGGKVGDLANDSVLAMTIAFSGTKNYTDLSVVVSNTALDTNADIYLFTYGEFPQDGNNGTVDGVQIEPSLPGWDANKDVIKVGEPLKMVNGAVNFKTVIGRGTYVLATFTDPPTKEPDEGTAGQLTVTYEHPQGITGTVPQDETKYTASQVATVLGNTATVTNRAFTGWTVKGSADGKVYKAGEKIAVPESGLTLVSAWDITNVQFFLRKDSTVQLEDGTTHYPSVLFTPHRSMYGQVSGNAFVSGADALIKDGKVGGKDGATPEDVAATVALFADVQKAITVAPEEAVIQEVISTNFGKAALDDYNTGKTAVLWYVVKDKTGDGCPSHVDGVLYNKGDGKLVEPATYTYTVEHRYFTQAFGENIDFNNPGRKTTNPVRLDETIGKDIKTGAFIPGELSGPFTATKSTLTVGPGKSGAATSDIKLKTTRTTLPDGDRDGDTIDYKVNYVEVKDTVTVDGKVDNKYSTKCSATSEYVNMDANKTTNIIVYYLYQVDGGRLNYDWNNPTDTNNKPIPVSADFKLPEDPRLYSEPDHITILNPSYKVGDKWVRIGEKDDHIQNGGNGETAVLKPEYLAKRDEMIEGYRFIGWIRKYYTADTRYFSGFQMAPETWNSFKFVNVESRAGKEPTDNDTGETLIAQWVKLNTITYEIGDHAPEYTGTLPTDDKKYETGENATLAKEPGVKDPTNLNNKLIGWIIDGTFYELGKTIKMPDHDVVAKGVWEGDVKYDANFPEKSDSKGTAPTDDNSYRVSGDKSTVTVLDKNDMTATGYEFKGWQLVTGKDDHGNDIIKDSANEGGLWQSTDKVDFGYNYTFKGVWGGEVKYDANFPENSDSKGAAPTDAKSYLYDDSVTVLGQNGMTVTGYEFKGWQLVTGKDDHGNDIVKANTDRDDGLWQAHGKVPFNYNYTFKGVWVAKDKVTVTFYAGDYNNDRRVVVSTQTIDPTANRGTGEVIKVPNSGDVSRNYNYSSGNVSYLFNGTWSKAVSGDATEIPNKTTENLNFYARYNTTTIPGVVTSETTAPNTPPPGVITTAPDDQNRESAATTPQNPTQPTRPGTPDETGVGGVSPNEGGPNTLVEDITGNPPAATPVIAPVVNTPATIGNILNSLIGNLPANAVVGTGTIPAALPTALLNEEDIGNNLTPTGGLTPEEDIGNNRIPVAAGSGVASWALLNLLLAIATLAGCVFRVIGYFTNKKHPESDEAYAQASADTAVQFSYGEAKNVDGDRPIEDEKIIRRKALARLFSIVPAVIAIVTFFLTEDVTQPMVLIDKYTLFMMAIAIVQLVVALVFSKKKLKKDDDNKGGMDKGALANA